MSNPLVGFGGTYIQPQRKKVFYSGTGALVKGQAVFYNRDHGTAATADAGRDWYVEDASDGNYHRFAGVTSQAYSAKAAGQRIEIYEPPGVMMVYTNQSCTVDTTNLAINSSGYFDALGAGFPIALALQTVDRSSTNGTVLAYVKSPSEIDPWWGTAGGAGGSPIIWQTCPWDMIQRNNQIGYSFFDDFVAFPSHTGVAVGSIATELATSLPQLTPPLSYYNTYMDVGGSLLDGAEPGGSLKLTVDGNNEACALQSGVAPFLIDTTNAKKMWFEARIKMSAIANTQSNFFVGLMQPGLSAEVPMLDAGTALADKNLIGWHRREADGDILDIVHKADGQTFTIAGTDAVTLVANTWKKVGFYFNGSTIYFYDDGVVETATVTTTEMGATTFPDDSYMAPVIALCAANTSTHATAEIDWWRMAQLR